MEREILDLFNAWAEDLENEFRAFAQAITHKYPGADFESALRAFRAEQPGLFGDLVEQLRARYLASDADLPSADIPGIAPSNQTQLRRVNSSRSRDDVVLDAQYELRADAELRRENELLKEQLERQAAELNDAYEDIRALENELSALEDALQTNADIDANWPKLAQATYRNISNQTRNQDARSRSQNFWRQAYEIFMKYGLHDKDLNVVAPRVYNMAWSIDGGSPSLDAIDLAAEAVAQGATQVFV